MGHGDRYRCSSASTNYWHTNGGYVGSWSFRDTCGGRDWGTCCCSWMWSWGLGHTSDWGSNRSRLGTWSLGRSNHWWSNGGHMGNWCLGYTANWGTAHMRNIGWCLADVDCRNSSGVWRRRDGNSGHLTWRRRRWMGGGNLRSRGRWARYGGDASLVGSGDLGGYRGCGRLGEHWQFVAAGVVAPLTDLGALPEHVVWVGVAFALGCPGTALGLNILAGKFHFLVRARRTGSLAACWSRAFISFGGPESAKRCVIETVSASRCCRVTCNWCCRGGYSSSSNYRYSCGCHLSRWCLSSSSSSVWSCWGY
jgi:hypothetical protein